MLEEQSPPKIPTIGELHLLQRKRLTDRHEFLMEKILKENSHKSKYWILGRAKTKRKNRRTTITPILEVYDEKPEVRKESYLYEVDNVVGTRSLLWIMHPNGKFDMPSIGKSIRVADESGV